MMKRLFKLMLCWIVLSTCISVQAEETSYLVIAAGKGKIKMVNAMLGSGENPNAADRKGVTALMYAARKNRVNIVDALLAQGADVNLKDQVGWTALMFAIKKNHAESAKRLLEKGADPIVVDSSGWSAVNLAAIGGYAAILDALANTGLDINAKNPDNKTALMFAAKGGDPATVQILFDHHANLLARDQLGATALMYAARAGQPQVIDLFYKHLAAPALKEKRAEIIDQYDDSQWTALTWAVRKSKHAAAQALIYAGADVNHKDSQDTPILHLAVDNGDQSMVMMLLKNHVNVKAKDKYGLTALVYALKGKHAAIAKQIKDAGGSY